MKFYIVFKNFDIILDTKCLFLRLSVEKKFCDNFFDNFFFRIKTQLFEIISSEIIEK